MHARGNTESLRTLPSSGYTCEGLNAPLIPRYQKFGGKHNMEVVDAIGYVLGSLACGVFDPAGASWPLSRWFTCRLQHIEFRDHFHWSASLSCISRAAARCRRICTTTSPSTTIAQFWLFSRLNCTSCMCAMRPTSVHAAIAHLPDCVGVAD
jgi:hypothetical protein